jgi:tetratricopeptide (TPR) repeat protein
MMQVAGSSSDILIKKLEHAEDELGRLHAAVAAAERAAEAAERQLAEWEDARLYRLPPIERRWYEIGPVIELRRISLLRGARLAMRRRNWAHAAALFRDALSIRSGPSGIWVEFGHALKESGDYVEAVRVYRRVLILEPDHHDVQSHLAFAKQAAGSGSAGRRGAGPVVRRLGTRLNLTEMPTGRALATADAELRRKIVLRDLELATPL